MADDAAFRDTSVAAYRAIYKHPDQLCVTEGREMPPVAYCGFCVGLQTTIANAGGPSSRRSTWWTQHLL